MFIDTTPSPRAGTSEDVIRIRGARMHNLKNVDLDIPHDRFTVITGPSGSGKSSLAFDTLYAEGQRQYIESLSVYARQFVEQLERPDVDLIDGLPPTLCIDQRPGNANPRSTVATVTEVYDYLRVLMARLGQVHCWRCNEPISQQSPEQIQDTLIQLPEGTKLMLLAPMVRGRRGKHEEVFARIRKAGFVRARVDGRVYDIDNLPELEACSEHQIEAIADRVIIRPGIRSRLGESLRLGLRHGEGVVIACYLDASLMDDQSPDGRWVDRVFSTLYACPNCKLSLEELEPRTFSFNSPYGACPACEGLGQRERFDPAQVCPQLSKSLAQGAILPWRGARPNTVKKLRGALAAFTKQYGFDWDVPLRRLGPAVVQKLLHGDGEEFQGVLMMLEKEYATTTKAARLNELASYRAQVACPACGGSRLRAEANSVYLGGRTIHQICSLAISDAASFFANLQFDEMRQPIARPLLGEICQRLSFLEKVGVSYLSLNRPADTLSGGELQRVRLATSIGSGLAGVCYVLDEPSIGLHPRDNDRLIQSLRELKQRGNTVLVVEHDEAMMRAADWLIDVGPGAGVNGGQIVAQGTPQQIAQDATTITGQYLGGRTRIPVPKKRRRAAKSRMLTIQGVETNNLKQIDVRLPLGLFVCITGVSGSGKSSLINETLAREVIRRVGGTAPKPGPFRSLRGTGHIDKVVQVDQRPIGRSPRSTPATYIGVFDEIRKVFANLREARQRGFTVSRFSFNVKGGRCEACQGHGVKKIEMNFLPDLYVTCDQCRGARFNRQTLQVRFRGKSIADVLQMSVDEGVVFFEAFDAIHRALQSLKDVGLGYLQLGQPSTTFSGGEAQRIKLATELAKKANERTLYLFDEPTTGLHFDDIRRLLNVLNRLVDRRNSVIVIEHNLEVIKTADWIIDLGPEGGDAGGRIVAEGTPEDIAAVPDSYTGQAIRRVLNGAI